MCVLCVFLCISYIVLYLSSEWGLICLYLSQELYLYLYICYIMLYLSSEWGIIYVYLSQEGRLFIVVPSCNIALLFGSITLFFNLVYIETAAMDRRSPVNNY